MSQTTDELTDITRALNKVQTVGQARLAIGTTLKALSAAFKVAEMIPTQVGVPVLRESYKRQLNAARVNLEDWYGRIPGQGTEDYRYDWSLNRWKVEKAYVEIAGVEGAAEYVPRTSNLEILSDALRGAPALFGETVGDILNKAAETAGKVGAGLAKGLGIWGWGAIIVAVVVVVIILGGKQAVVSKLTGGAA